MAATKYTAKKGQAVLDSLSQGLSITAAMKAVDLNRSQYYNWREDVDGFAVAADAALESGTDRLEDVAKARAEESSDTLLIFLLKARRREKYGDKQHLEHTGTDGQPLKIIIERVEKATE